MAKGDDSRTRSTSFQHTSVTQQNPQTIRDAYWVCSNLALPGKVLYEACLMEAARDQKTNKLSYIVYMGEKNVQLHPVQCVCMYYNSYIF